MILDNGLNINIPDYILDIVKPIILISQDYFENKTRQVRMFKNWKVVNKYTHILATPLTFWIYFS